MGNFIRISSMNAIEFLTEEHNKVRQMLSSIEENKKPHTVKVKLFDILADNLLRHEKMEHQLWYPHFRDKLPKTVQHLLTDEKGAEKAIKKLEGLDNEQIWDQTFAKFKKDVEQHAQEEEENLFPEVRHILSVTELKKIGKEMRQFKAEH